MSTHHRALDCDPVVARTIQLTALRVARLYHLNAADEADLRQEMYLALLQSQHLFDPSRSTWKTFVKLVTTTALRQYLRLRLPERREQTGCRLCEDSADGHGEEFEALLDSGSPDASNPRLLLLALWEVYPRLTPLLQRLCRLALAGYNREEMAACVGLTRNGVEYRMNLLWRYLNGEVDPCPQKSRVLFHKNA